MTQDTWNVDQYEKFKAQRSQPFYDLLALVQPEKIQRAVDLGCGTGELTAVLHRKLKPASTVGVDSSEAMLAESRKHEAPGLKFERMPIENYSPREKQDLIFSNAALQWVPDHQALLGRLTGFLAPGGQLAVQVPANHDHPSHRVAAEVAASAPFRDELGSSGRAEIHVLNAETYSEILYRLGFREQRVRMEIYAHPMPSKEEVIEWVKGTLLTGYQKRMTAAAFERFLAQYRERLLDELGRTGDYLYTYKRILFWAKRPA